MKLNETNLMLNRSNFFRLSSSPIHDHQIAFSKIPYEQQIFKNIANLFSAFWQIIFHCIEDLHAVKLKYISVCHFNIFNNSFCSQIGIYFSREIAMKVLLSCQWKKNIHIQAPLALASFLYLSRLWNRFRLYVLSGNKTILLRLLCGRKLINCQFIIEFQRKNIM